MQCNAHPQQSLHCMVSNSKRNNIYWHDQWVRVLDSPSETQVDSTNNSITARLLSFAHYIRKNNRALCEFSNIKVMVQTLKQTHITSCYHEDNLSLISQTATPLTTIWRIRNVYIIIIIIADRQTLLHIGHMKNCKPWNTRLHRPNSLAS